MEGKSVLKDLYDSYKKHDAHVRKLEAELEETQRKLCKLRKNGGWYNRCLVPLAKLLAKKLKMTYSIYGPFGLGAETTIYFFPRRRAGNITRDEHYSITLHPATRNHHDWKTSFAETFYFTYNTGEQKEEYAPGTLGEMNGFNNVEAELPDDMDAIVEIVKSNHFVPGRNEDAQAVH